MKSETSVPTVLVVFGATGDLMARKIAPALLYLHSRGDLPERFRVIGFARRPFSDEEFRGRVTDHLRKSEGGPHEAPPEFLEMFSYQQGTFEDEAAYQALSERMKDIDGEWETCSNKLYYLAVPPEQYRLIFQRLAGSGLTEACGGDLGWTRVLVEKPFGRDAASAQELDELLGMLFREEQIYRIDHYLAKEMLQGILNFRFSNNLFEPSWDHSSIERIEVSLLEEVGVEDRGDFYDAVGALRDVGQNHVLQMLALVTMDQPLAMTAEAIRAKRAELLKRLIPLSAEEVASQTVRAQFDGFREVEGVSPDSGTETYFRLTTRIDGVRWEGVPVVLQAGKRMPRARKRIVTRFRHPPACFCEGEKHYENEVAFNLEPVESITIGFWTKRPGLEKELERRDFNFLLYEKREKTQYVEEYSRLLADCIHGDQTLFVSTAEVRAMWDFIDPVEKAWAQDAAPLQTYAPGTAEALALVPAVQTVVEPGTGLRHEIGVIGLGKMGRGIARNLIDHRWHVVGYNRTRSVAEGMAEEGLEPAFTLPDLVGVLEPPRIVWLMLPAGPLVDEFLFAEGGFASLLQAGDILIDGGNSLWKDSARRAEQLEAAGIHFLDVGTSGGPAGARSGACLMIGGERDLFEYLRPLWRDLSVPDGYRHFEGAGAGHFVKMVHNGIEYGMMQAIAEGFSVMKRSDLRLDLSDVAEVYNRGSVIESRLVGWLERAFETHGLDLEAVSATVGRTGEGEWTVQAAEELGVKARVIEAALEFRKLSETEPSYTGKVLSALREQFGGHSIA